MFSRIGSASKIWTCDALYSSSNASLWFRRIQLNDSEALLELYSYSIQLRGSAMAAGKDDEAIDIPGQERQGL